MADVIRTGVTDAWSTFMTTIAPVADRVKEVIKGIMLVFNSLIDVIGSNLSAVFTSGGFLLKGDGTLLDTIKSAFSPENIRVFFVMVSAAIYEIGIQLNSLIGTLATVLNSMKAAFFLC